MAEKSIHKKIENRIKRMGRGSILFPTDFADLGNTEVAKKALLRLENRGFLKRLAFGIYLYPKKSKLLGELTPSIEEIAKAIAERDEARIIPTGSYALNRLGLSTQVPLNVVYLTDGVARKVKVGKGYILFKKVSPKNVATIGPISSLVIQALKAIGSENVEEYEIKKILELLDKEKQDNIKNDMTMAPEWIRKIMRKSLKPNDGYEIY